MIEKPVFLSISGSHLYGIPKPEDIDIRGAHIINEENFWKNFGKQHPSWCIEKIYNGIDIVSHEIQSYVKEMLKPNVNFIEQVLSPITIVRSEYYPELQDLARDCVSKAMYAHWKGFAMHTAYHAVTEDYKKPKRNLYLLRIYYQGISVARTEMLRSDFDSFRKLDCFNDSLVQGLFDCKKNGVDFFDKHQFLTHCSELEKILQDDITKSNLREAPSPQTKESAMEFVKNIYKKEFGWSK
jgi:hypothetical protein